MIDQDVAACYDMSLKEFEHSGVHNLFKVSELFYLVLLIIYTCILFNKILICVGNV